MGDTTAAFSHLPLISVSLCLSSVVYLLHELTLRDSLFAGGVRWGTQEEPVWSSWSAPGATRRDDRRLAMCPKHRAGATPPLAVAILRS
eukprot:SAG11_NODE_27_length_23309_cov_10.579362_17_plen_89_part_00